MENRIWKNNLEALEKMFQGWGSFFLEEKYNLASEEEKNFIKDAEFRIEQTYTGEKVTVVCRNGKEYYLGGKYNPNIMAKRQVESCKGADLGSVILVVGFSDGRGIKALIEMTDESAVILVYEPCMDLFIHTLKNYDLTEVFLNRKIGLLIDGMNGDELYQILNQVITLESLTKIKTLIMGNYECLFENEVKNFIKIEKEIIKSLRVLWNTTLFFRDYAIFNILKNMKYLYDHYSINSFFNVLKEDIPVVVVAAGPSLDKNIELLKEVKGKACIIACDTALKPLLHRNIIPDFFVIIDAKKPLELFDEPRIKDIPVFCGLNVPYKFMKMHQGKKVIYYDNPFMGYVFNNVFEKCTRENSMSNVPTGGSVATTAFSIGRLMGAKNIILVGQDLALSGEKEHAEGTFKVDRKFDTEKGNFPMVEAIDGGQLPTLQNLKMYLEWFEEQIEKNSEIHVVDATEGGALIHGSEVLTLQEAITTYCTGEFSSDELWGKTSKHFSEKEKERVLEFWKTLPAKLEELEKEILHGKELYAELKILVEKDNYSLKKVKHLSTQIKEVNESLDKNPLVLLLTEAIRGVEYTLRSTVYHTKENDKTNLLESIRMGECFLEGLRVAIRDTRPEFVELGAFDGTYD